MGKKKKIHTLFVDLKINNPLLKKQCGKLSNKEAEYYYECEDFSCKNIEKLEERYREKYNMSVIENLEFIKEKSIEIFLKQ